jgi:hypothetical protein
MDLNSTPTSAYDPGPTRPKKPKQIDEDNRERQEFHVGSHDHQPSGSWVECGNQVFCTPFPWGCNKALQHFCFKSKSEHSLHLFAFLTARGSLSQYRNPNRLFREISWKRLRVCDLRVSIHTFKSRISFAEWRVCLCKAASSCRGSFHESCS